MADFVDRIGGRRVWCVWRFCHGSSPCQPPSEAVCCNID
jgi:hypothetical protein